MIETSQFATAEGMIDLGIGQPQLSLLPYDLLQRAAKRTLTGRDNSLLNYGPARGDGYFRLALAEFLSRGYGIPVDPATLMATGGASQALAMLAGALAKPGDVVLVEEPTYFLAHQIFADAGLKVVGVEIGSEGLEPEALAEAIAEHKPRLLYTIPVHQNPSGVTMNKSARSQIVELCRQNEVLILADEVYQLLTYEETVPPPLASFLDSEAVISIGSFSKILAPGLRLGWLQAAPSILDSLTSLGMFASGGGVNQFTGCLVRSILESGEQRSYLESLREIYYHRVNLLDGWLNEILGDRVAYRKPQGGYFFWVRLTRVADAAALLSEATRLQVGYRAGSRFSTSGLFPDYLRLSFAHYGDDDLRHAVERLEQVLRSSG